MITKEQTVEIDINNKYYDSIKFTSVWKIFGVKILEREDISVYPKMEK